MKLLQFAKSPRRILFVGAEAAPFVKVGGLASVMDSLPRALRDRGCDARVMIPKYLSIEEKYGLSLAHKGLNVPTGNSAGPTHLVCNVKIFEPKAASATLLRRWSVGMLWAAKAICPSKSIRTRAWLAGLSKFGEGFCANAETATSKIAENSIFFIIVRFWID